MFLHRGIEFLGKIIGDIWHAWFLFIGPAQAAFVFASLLAVLFFGILAVTIGRLDGQNTLTLSIKL